jgi:hypothetical protein
LFQAAIVIFMAGLVDKPWPPEPEVVDGSRLRCHLSASITASATVICSRAAGDNGCAASHVRPARVSNSPRCGQPW